MSASGLLLAVILAGCVADEGDPSRPAARGDADRGLFILGIVIDDAYLPIEGATISTTKDGGPLTAASDAGGRFKLGPVEPGRYAVVAEKEGYAPASTDVTVAEDELASITLVLEPVAISVPYHETEVHVTFVACASRNLIGGVPCTKLPDYILGTNVSSSEKFAFNFIVLNPGLVDLLVEMDWETQQYGKDMLFYIQTPPNQPLTAATTKYFAMDGAPPLRGWVLAGVKNGDNVGVFDAEPKKTWYEAATVWSYDNSTIPFTSLYLNHRAETWMTFFYNRAGPRDFTALPPD